MNTAQILREKFGDRYVPLEKIAQEYYGVADPRTINRMAAGNKFGALRPFKARDSERSPWIVDIEQLADVLDRRAQNARNS